MSYTDLLRRLHRLFRSYRRGSDEMPILLWHADVEERLVGSLVEASQHHPSSLMKG